MSKVGLSNSLASIALAISLVTAVISFNQQNHITRLETSYFRTVEASVVSNSQVMLLPKEKFESSVIDPPVLPANPSAVAAIWVEVRVTNTGLRTFSVHSVSRGIDSIPGGGAAIFGNFGYSELEGVYTSFVAKQDNQFSLPVAIEPGEQIRFYCQLVLPVGPEVARTLGQGGYKTSPELLLINTQEENKPTSALRFFTSSHLRVLVDYADKDFTVAPVDIY
jgi:hypothetical protein